MKKYILLLLLLVSFISACAEPVVIDTIQAKDLIKFAPSINYPYYWNYNKKVYMFFTIDRPLVVEKEEITSGLFREPTEIDKEYRYVAKEDFVVYSSNPLDFYIGKRIKAYGVVSKNLEFGVLQIIEVY